MTRDDILRMAREANLPDPMVFYASIERFAALVAAADREACAAHYLDIARKAIEEEREACAKVCDALGDEFSDANSADCATAIRARSKQ